MNHARSLFASMLCCVPVLAALLSLPSSALADHAQEASSQLVESQAAAEVSTGAVQLADADVHVEYGEPIDSGAVVVGGRLLELPFRVGAAGNEVFINGQRVAVLPRGEGAVRGKGASASEKSQRAVNNLVARIERELYNDMMLLAFDEKTRLFVEPEMDVGFFDTLLQAKSSPELLPDLVQQCFGLSSDSRGNESITTAQWRVALAAFEPSEELQQYIRDLNPDDGGAEVGTGVAYGDLPRSRRAQKAYLLTVFGMVLVVVSAGTLLSHRPETTLAWSSIADGSAQVRLIRDCLTLIVLLSVFDLLCTVMAGTTGGFEELNPLASSWTKSPAVLAGFKVTATAGGVGILLWLRKYTGAQLASWWLCLLLTVLTVRWITVQSLLLA